MRRFLIVLPFLASAAFAQSNVEWPAYGNDAGGSHYSPLRGITKDNVNKLTVAWSYRTGALEPKTDLNRKAAFEATPLMVGGTLYVITPFDKVIALDPATGKERWTYDPKVDRGHGYSEVTSRGVAIWKGSRVFFATIDGRLICADAKSGKPCSGFAQVDLNHDSEQPEPGEHEVTSAPAIVGNLVVVGSAMGDNGRVDMGRGLVRAYDVHNGKLRWTFNTLLPLGDNNRSGAANAWATISVDAARNLLFVPTSSPSPDYFGGLRPGHNNYANSVVALDASTGNVVWHFQVVHHDLWDYDVASQPVLIMFHGKGKSIPAVAVTTKMGHLFILDRRSGKPLLPIEERDVPKSDVAEERASPTQPFPVNPSMVPNRLRAEDAWGLDDAEREACRAKIAALRNEGIFTPPSLQGTLSFPGNVGGVAWGGAGYDPLRRLLIAPTNRIAASVKLIPRDDYATARERASDNRLTGEFGRQRGAPYAMYRELVMSPKGVPCNPPPWSTLTAVDVDSGAIKWDVPLGRMTIPTNPPRTIEGTAALGGPLLTASGLVFISATIQDDTLRAFDSTNGKVIWESKLPAGAQSTPMTYKYKGKQYVVIAAGGHGKAQTTMGDYVVAYRLP